MTRAELIDAFEKLLEAAEQAEDYMRRAPSVCTEQWAIIHHAVTVARERLGDARLTTPDPQVYNDISPG